NIRDVNAIHAEGRAPALEMIAPDAPDYRLRSAPMSEGEKVTGLSNRSLKQLEKSPTGVSGLDEITDRGLPKGHITLICSSADSGKTLISMQFLARGAIPYDGPGVFTASEDGLSKNFASLGICMEDLSARKKALLDYVHIDSSEIEETGEYDLEGLFIRLGSAVDSILIRLFRWLKDRGVTPVVTIEPWVKSGLLHIHTSRPMAYGLEIHLVEMRRIVEKLRPGSVIIDPITNLVNVGTESDVRSMLYRMVDNSKTMGITTLCTSLISSENSLESGQGVSSLMDTWLKLSLMESDSERNRSISVVNSRSMAHSNQTRELVFTENDVDLKDVYLGPAGSLLMGTSRAAQEASEMADATTYEHEIDRCKRELERKLKSLNAHITILNS
ncbi:MAG TPA: ATPase domain-containing protein, partial [Methanotrichaceae archaeon]|nr:ATPase domain-containing protein [Methanotrichaceae archaeon]